jgi:hypothetical protein
LRPYHALSVLHAGIRRVEVPGDNPDLSYPRDRSLRFTNEIISPEGKIYKYRCVDQPALLHVARMCCGHLLLLWQLVSIVAV